MKNRSEPFLGCVFLNEKNFPGTFLVLIGYAENGDAALIMATYGHGETDNVIKVNVKKGLDLNLLKYTLFEIPCDGLYGFEVVGFISEDAILKVKNSTKNKTSLEKKEDTDALQEIFLLRSEIIEYAAYAPMAAPDKVRIEDFSVSNYSMERESFCLNFVWYPDQDRCLKIKLDKKQKAISFDQLLNGFPCSDTMLINGIKCSFDKNGRYLATTEQANYIAGLFGLPNECNLFLNQESTLESLINTSNKIFKEIKEMFEFPLLEKSFALASSNSVQKSYSYSNGRISINLNSDCIGNIDCTFTTPKNIAMCFKKNDGSLVHAGLHGEDPEDYLILEANSCVDVWLVKQDFDAEKISIVIFEVEN
jgi:hypothetical protein